MDLTSLLIKCWFFPSYSLFTKLGCPRFSFNTLHCFTGFSLSPPLCNFLRISLLETQTLPTTSAYIQNCFMTYISPVHRRRNTQVVRNTGIHTRDVKSDVLVLNIHTHTQGVSNREFSNWLDYATSIEGFDFQIVKQNLSHTDKNQDKIQRSWEVITGVPAVPLDCLILFNTRKTRLHSESILFSVPTILHFNLNQTLCLSLRIKGRT